ncbi:DNA-binding winged helix-turn-helix (wHTH) domain-containing protein [Reichenbachiella faecimaris]|uniref:DNA-binding winged helix-turn-helix (WHTH) domain-containing protein n=1 Tax=Reichenbachiella faecimaris TaxID=692418 RepID=A0A1W2G7E4_REIFA|nr:winged helix-turn-helix domain-containing protein [Reichenbachiella faecimaris]SMD32600.1 DNA-binding winged helix-turn-helix (wHTH) domain-containing protein [Reichenbachiella faecimaris]
MNIVKLNSHLEINGSTDELIIKEEGIKNVIKVENQVMKILLLLIEYDGKLVEKGTFIREIWDGNKLSGEKALTKNIFKIRNILKTNKIENVALETIPKKGYRLVVVDDPINSRESGRVRYVIAVGLIFIGVVGFFFFKKESERPKLHYFNIDEIGNDSIIYLGNEKLQIIKNDSLIEVSNVTKSKSQD